jgi:hypothetical protein
MGRESVLSNQRPPMLHVAFDKNRPPRDAVLLGTQGHQKGDLNALTTDNLQSAAAGCAPAPGLWKPGGDGSTLCSRCKVAGLSAVPLKLRSVSICDRPGASSLLCHRC